MNMTRKLLPPLALVGALALVPVATSAFAAADTANYAELETFMSVYERVKANYVDPVDDHTLIKGAIDGMLAALDPHSSYVEASDSRRCDEPPTVIRRLGLTVSPRGAVKVISPTEDTPAWRAGIKAGDFITHINSELLYGLTLDEAVDKLRGPPGSGIKLTIVRPGRDKPFDVTMVRERIELRPVKWEIKDGIGVININTFAANTGDATKAALVAIDKATGGRPLGYVVDLRSNPGGLLDQAIEVSDAFLDHGEIVSQRGREKGDIERFMPSRRKAHGFRGADGRRGSASAAEIVAGALQDQRRAIVMGERSSQGLGQTVVQTGRRAREVDHRPTSRRRGARAGRRIDPDIAVPQLSDADYKDRPRVREADLRRHLLSEAKADDKLLEHDDAVDPRFSATAEQLEKKGVKDFQLDYAVKTSKRLAPGGPAMASAGTRPKSR